MQESLVKFNRFLLVRLFTFCHLQNQDNDAKRNEAERKFFDSKKIIEQKESEILKFQDQLEILKKESQEKRLLFDKCNNYIHETI